MQFGLEPDFGGRSVVTRDSTQKNLDGYPPYVVCGLLDGGDRVAPAQCSWKLVETGNGHVAGHLEAPLDHGRNGPYGHLVVGDEDGLGRRAPVEQLASGVVPALHVKIAVDHQVVPQRDARRRKCLLVAHHPFDPGGGAIRPSDDGDPFVALTDEPLRGLTGSGDVVNQHGVDGMLLAVSVDGNKVDVVGAGLHAAQHPTRGRVPARSDVGQEPHNVGPVLSQPVSDLLK